MIERDFTGESEMHAVLKTGGKQYRVQSGETILVEKYPAEVGDNIELGPLLLIQDDEKMVIDAEQLKDSKAICQVLRQDRAKKIIVFKKKRRKNYRKTQGHRQSFTRLKVLEIISGQTKTAEVPQSTGTDDTAVGLG